MTYFEISDSLEFPPGRWYLGEPFDATGNSVDARSFTYAQFEESPGPLQIEVYQAGIPLDFTFAAFEMPIVKRSVADLISALAPDDIQRFPVKVAGYGQSGDYEILNVIRERACVDESKSKVVKWGIADGRPEKIGEYRMITELHVEPGSVLGSQLFRIRGYHPILICSDTIKSTLEANHIQGIRFTQV